jgi:SAM-dependent methyltransferase
MSGQPTPSIQELIASVPIVCPEDQSLLVLDGDALRCPGCNRCFPVRNDRWVDLLPLRPQNLGESFSEEYRSGYEAAFTEPFEYAPDAVAWGAPEKVSPRWAGIRDREAALVLRMLDDPPLTTVLCDFSGGAGYYTLKCAPHFKMVLHCDLSVASLSYVSRKAVALGLGNILFLRIDYLNPPFRASLPRVICMDTLIRGPKHEGLLLRQIDRALVPGGKAVVDFHNWWHNPLRQVGLLRDNWRENTSYRKSEVDELFRGVAIEPVRYAPFYQEIDPDRPVTTMLRHLIPPTRLVYQFTKS